MALSLIHFQDDATNSTPATFTSSFGGVDVPAGSLLVAIISESTNSAGGGTLTDNAGNTYTALITKNPNNATANGFVRVWYCNNCLHLTTAANNFLYTPVGGAGVKVAARWYAFSGAASGNPFDAAVTASAVGSTGIPQVTSGTPAQSNEFFIGVVCVDNTPGTIGLLLAPYSNDQDAIGSTAMLDMADFSNTGVGTGLVKTGGTNTRPWAAVALGIKPPQTLVGANAAGSYSITGKSAGLYATLARVIPVASGETGFNGTLALTCGVAIPAGSLILVARRDDSSVTSARTITDSKSQTWTKISQTPLNNNTGLGPITLWYAWNCIAMTTSDTITTAGNSAEICQMSICYVTGIQKTSDPLDSAVTATSFGAPANAPTVTSGTPAVANEFFIGVYGTGISIVTDEGFNEDTTHAWRSSPPRLWNGDGTRGGAIDWGALTNSGTGTKVFAPSFNTSTNVNWGVIVAGFKPTTAQALTLLAAPGVYTITGAPDLLATAHLMKLAAGSYAITGTAAKFVESRLIKLAAGSYTISGTAAKLETDRSQQLPAGSYALTGFDVTLATAHFFPVSPGSYTITGDAATFAIARVILAGAGVYTITGFPDSNVEALHLLASAGAYSLTGFDTGMIIAPAATEDDRDHRGERGQSHGRMPPPERRHHAELELFRNQEYARGVAAAAPPATVANRNLTTTQHPQSRPVTAPVVYTGRPK